MKHTLRRITFLLTAMILFAFQLAAQQNIASITYSEQTKGKQILKFELGDYSKHVVTTPRGEAFVIRTPESSPVLAKGYPNLPRFVRSLIIPEGKKAQVKVINSQYSEVKDIDIAPSKGNLLRNVNPKEVPYTYSKVYDQDVYYPKEISGSSESYIFRKYKGQTIYFYPFQYNATQRTLKVYESITLEITFTPDKDFSGFIPEKIHSEFNEEFEAIYRNHFINYQQTKYDPIEERGNMLIISHSDFMSTMESYIQWKKQAGIPVEMVDVSTIGDSDAIKTYVSDYYTDNGLTYLLLVGDAEQVPPYYKSGDSDPAYGHITGEDSYPEVIVGRFSGETTDQIATQVQRSVDYEKNPSASGEFYQRAMGIASQEGGGGQGDDGEVDYEHSRNMLTDLDNYTYTYTAELFEGDQGDEDASGDPAASDVATELNEGSGLILYTGHGSNTSWGTSGFSIDGINSLTNDNMLPFIFDVACVNGNFNGLTCFAEAWMRATNNGNPTGAVAIIASTINQAWNPPMSAQDEMIDILVESYTNNIKRTFGGITADGCMLMNDEYSTEGSQMTDTWTIFGDPSLMVRTDAPTSFSPTHDAVIVIGASSFTVSAPGEGYATLVKEGELLGKAELSGGSATINFEPQTEVGKITLTLTGYNKTPYITELDVISPDKPYIVLDSISHTDDLGNNNQVVDYGETIYTDVRLANVSNNYDAFLVMDSLSTEDPYIRLIDSLESYGKIDSISTSFIEDAFAYEVSDSVPDQHIANFTMHFKGKDSLDNEYTWNSEFSVVINAPELSVGEMMVVDTGGDNNGILDAGESGLLKILVKNEGHASTSMVYGKLSASAKIPYLTIESDSSGMFTIAAEEHDTLVFAVTADESTPLEDTTEVLVEVFGASQKQYRATATKDVIIGEIPRIYMHQEGVAKTNTGYFYDSGGETSSYSNNENYTVTIQPATPGKMTKVIFTSFDVEAKSEDGCWDYLQVYNGSSASAPEIGSYCNETPPGTITAENADGALTFVFYSDGYVTKPGWVAEITTITLDTLVFTVMEDVDSLANVSVKLDGKSKATNSQGQATFLKEPGTYSYTITKNGYHKSEGNVTVSGTTYKDVSLNKAYYDITFNIQNEDGSASMDAEIQFMGNKVSTTAGSYTFTDLVYQDDVPFSVVPEDSEYLAYEGTVDIHSTKDVNVELDVVEYGVEVTVLDENDEPLQGAEVTIDGYTRTTPEDGMVSFWLTKGKYPCKINKYNYATLNDTVNVTDTMATSMKILQIFTVNFTVKDSITDEFVSDATILIDTSQIYTNTVGKADIELPYGEYTYTIQAEGYFDYQGEISVTENTTKLVKIADLSTNTNRLDASKVAVYPNPVSEMLYIDVDQNLRNGRIVVRDISGRLVEYKTINAPANRIDVSDYEPGMYVIVIESDQGIFNQKIFIQ